MLKIVKPLGLSSILERCSIFSMLFLLLSCSKQDSIGLGQDASLSSAITDTVTVQTSTLLLDSLPSAGKGVMLVGRMEDPELGDIRAASYFQVTPTEITASSLPDDARFDSVRLKLNYSGYYYGDTSVTQEIDVRQLKARIALPSSPGVPEPEEEDVFSGSATFYNRSKVPYEEMSMGAVRFKPRPGSKDSLMIRLSNSEGSKLFSLVKSASSIITSPEEFLDYFKGIALISGHSAGNAVIGYKDTAEVKLYYSYTGSDGLLKRAELKFGLYNNSYQFNNIEADRASTNLRSISLANNLTEAGQTSERTYIQGGIGLVTKIEMPYLSYLSQRDKTAINKAELIIGVPPGFDKPFTPPAKLILFVANKNNRPASILTDSKTQLSQLTLNRKDEVTGVSYYTFPLTDYVTHSGTTYQNTSLLLSLPVADLETSVNRAVLGSARNPQASIKLRITYTNLNL